MRIGSSGPDVGRQSRKQRVLPSVASGSSCGDPRVDTSLGV